MHSTGALPPIERGLLLGTAAIWFLLELRQSTNHRADAVRADQGSRFVLRLAILAGAVVASVAAESAPAASIGATAFADWIGLGVLWCGIALRLWSFHTLGRYFTFTVQTSSDQPTITRGPYRVIRHPSYAGILFAVTGVGVFIGNWLSLIGLIAAVACGLVFRIRVEERALVRDLGADYSRYAATHKRLVPFIW